MGREIPILMSGPLVRATTLRRMTALLAPSKARRFAESVGG